MNEYIPKVGEVCEIKHKNATSEWALPDFHPAMIKAMGDELMIIESSPLCGSTKESVGRISDYYFRPIKSARDKAIDEICESVCFPRAICASFYDAGCRKVKPLGFGEFSGIINEGISHRHAYEKLINQRNIFEE